MPGASLGEPERWSIVAFVRAIQSGTLQEAVEGRSQVLVPYERLLRAETEPENWLTYSGAYNGHRYSTLKKIRRDNVADLRLSWVVQLRTTNKVQTTPLVVDGVAYLTKPPNDVLAVDTRTGSQIWTYRYPINLEAVNTCCGPSNRGLALLNDKAYMGTLDGKLVALNTTTGKVVWIRDVARPIEGYAITSAPLAVKDKIVIGVAGGEFGGRGFLDAYDAETGERAWRFWTVPGPGEPGHETWEQEGSWKTGGAPTWLTGSFDPELNLVYWGTGNPGPPWIGDIRGGDNLYSDSVIALDADSGALQWHFQFTPHDVWDWDSNQVPVLADAEFEGRPRKLMLWPNRNAFFYVLDRVTGEFLLAEPFTTQTWAERISETGRPVVKPEAVPSREGTLVHPGFGATNWYSPSYSPQTGLLYVSAIDEYSEIFYSGGGLFGPGGEFTGIYPRVASGKLGLGAVRAIVPQDGQIRWEYRLPRRHRAGVLSTAGGLVFSGSEDGAFFALDASTGELLWQANLGGYVLTAPITYLSEGKQQILISAGGAVFAFALPPSPPNEMTVSSRMR
jgi:alcohol dehydrogenase (cytochrome c)